MTVVKKKKKPQEEYEKRVEELTQAVQTEVERIADNDFSDLGITIETDFRGYAVSMTIRIHRDKAGGLLKTHTYKRQP